MSLYRLEAVAEGLQELLPLVLECSCDSCGSVCLTKCAPLYVCVRKIAYSVALKRLKSEAELSELQSTKYHKVAQITAIQVSSDSDSWDSDRNMC